MSGALGRTLRDHAEPAGLGVPAVWIGLFAVTYRSLLRRIVVVLFHVVTLLVVATTTAYQYPRTTGCSF